MFPTIRIQHWSLGTKHTKVCRSRTHSGKSQNWMFYIRCSKRHLSPSGIWVCVYWSRGFWKQSCINPGKRFVKHYFVQPWLTCNTRQCWIWDGWLDCISCSLYSHGRKVCSIAIIVCFTWVCWYTAWLCRSRVKFAHQTHYVGDLRYMCSSLSTYTVTMLINIKLLCRAVNAQQIDTYQLKSLDGQFGE